MKLLLFLFLLPAFVADANAQNNPTLTAAYDHERKMVKLRWQHNDERITTYILQRSSDNVFFNDVYTQNSTDLADDELLKFNDTNLSPGKNYYRLKIFRRVSSYEATLPVMVIIGNPGGGWVIFPVPAGPLLNLQYNGTENIPGVISVVITSVLSNIEFTRLRLASNTRLIQIPIAHIGRGVYDIRVYVQDRVVWNQRFSK